MYRVILAYTGANRYGPEIDEYESMTDDQIMWDEMHDAWQDACSQAYNKAISSDQLEDMDYGQLVDFVADHARVSVDTAAYFVDKFMSWESDPLPLRAATSKVRRFVIKASR